MATRLTQFDDNSPPCRVFGLDSQEAEVFDRLKRAATSRESTSMVICGARGNGKHSLLRRVLWRLSTTVPKLDVVHLSGLVHTDAACALREVVRQITVRRDARLSSRYVDDLSVLEDELRRRVAERTAPLVIVLSHLESFALQNRQTLLYVLLDAMQSTSTAVLGLTEDRNVLQLFEKRVRSRLHNHRVDIGNPTGDDIRNMLDDYFEGRNSRWLELRDRLSFEDDMFSRRTYRRIATLAEAKGLSLESWQEAIRAHRPNSSQNWISSINNLPPPQLALVLTYLRFERDELFDYNLEKASLELLKLNRRNTSAVRYEPSVLVRAQIALIATTVLKLAQPNYVDEPAQLRRANVRLSGALSLEDVWTALKVGEIGCPTVLRQWVLQEQ